MKSKEIWTLWQNTYNLLKPEVKMAGPYAGGPVSQSTQASIPPNGANWKPKYHVGEYVTTAISGKKVQIMNQPPEVGEYYRVNGDLTSFVPHYEFYLENELVKLGRFDISPDEPSDLSDLFTEVWPTKEVKCECGSHAVGGGKHSTWCPMEKLEE